MMQLEVNGVGKRFGTKQIFTDISFRHAEGVLGIAGSNGSGKSTLMKCLAGLLTPTNGSIIWNSPDLEEPLGNEALLARIGFVAPYVNLYSELTARENLEFLADLRGIRPIAYQTELFHRLGLDRLLDIPYGKLSTGQQQRIKLASALFYEPDVLFLDEPGSNLDKAGRDVIEQIVATWRESGRLVILASNSKPELALCDRTISVESDA